MFIRKKSINGKEYAYLVENKYNKKKKQSRQKSTTYLGKVIPLGNFDRQTDASTIKDLLINELTSIGFKSEDNSLYMEKVNINLDNCSVRESNKKVCLQLNSGFLCDLTLSNLLKLDIENLNQKEIIQKLAESIILSGLNLKHETFINIYNNEIKAKTP